MGIYLEEGKRNTLLFFSNLRHGGNQQVLNILCDHFGKEEGMKLFSKASLFTAFTGKVDRSKLLKISGKERQLEALSAISELRNKKLLAPTLSTRISDLLRSNFKGGSGGSLVKDEVSIPKK